jgi:hypothetical protein
MKKLLTLSLILWSFTFVCKSNSYDDAEKDRRFWEHVNKTDAREKREARDRADKEERATNSNSSSDGAALLVMLLVPVFLAAAYFNNKKN